MLCQSMISCARTSSLTVTNSRIFYTEHQFVKNILTQLVMSIIHFEIHYNKVSGINVQTKNPVGALASSLKHCTHFQPPLHPLDYPCLCQLSSLPQTPPLAFHKDCEECTMVQSAELCTALLYHSASINTSISLLIFQMHAQRQTSFCTGVSMPSCG